MSWPPLDGRPPGCIFEQRVLIPNWISWKYAITLVLNHLSLLVHIPHIMGYSVSMLQEVILNSINLILTSGLEYWVPYGWGVELAAWSICQAPEPWCVHWSATHFCLPSHLAYLNFFHDEINRHIVFLKSLGLFVSTLEINAKMIVHVQANK